MQNSKDWRHGKSSQRRATVKSSTKRGCLIERIDSREAQAEMRWSR